jgi:hypothetical protein
MVQTMQLTIAVNFMHIFRRNTNNGTLFNNLRVFSANMLDTIQILHSNLLPVGQTQPFLNDL